MLRYRPVSLSHTHTHTRYNVVLISLPSSSFLSGGNSRHKQLLQTNFKTDDVLRPKASSSIRKQVKKSSVSLKTISVHSCVSKLLYTSVI